MINESENKDISITPDKATAWIENKIGRKSASKIAAERGAGSRTIYRYIADFDEFIKASEAYQNIPQRIVELIPSAIDVYEASLKNRDERGNVDNVALKAADNVLKIAGVLFERSKNEHSITTFTDEELTELEQSIVGYIGEHAGTDVVATDSAGEETPEN